MTECKEKLLTAIIRRYGFENDITVAFASLVEDSKVDDYTASCICRAILS